MVKKQRPSADRARLAVLQAGDEPAYRAHVLALLADGGRLGREAALDALVERPLASAREALRALFLELSQDGARRDQGAIMREQIVTVLRELRDVRDADIAALACDTAEVIFGQDVTWRLRALGLRMAAETAPELLPYLAAERMDDRAGEGGEPANTAFQLLAAMGHQAMIYRWLIAPRGGDEDQPTPEMLTVAFELLTEAPPQVTRRYADQAIRTAARRGQDALVIVLAEAIVRWELEASYPTLETVMEMKISAELYDYLALLIASTNRKPLLAVLERQLHRGRRPQAIAAALHVRTTPEQQRILERWDAGEAFDGEG